MRIFITWSGDRSKAVAEVIHQWLPSALQAVKTYFSPDDIVKGTRWFPEISKELDESSVGLLCMTRDNLTEPWLLFEAGALGKNVGKSKVCPLLFGIETTDLTGPLAQFQGARFEKMEFKKVVKMINAELGEGSLASDVFDGVFEKWWPELETKVKRILEKSSKHEKGQTRSERDLLEEILTLTRESGRQITPHNMEPGIISYLVSEYTDLLDCCEKNKIPGPIATQIERMIKPMLTLVHQTGFSRLERRELRIGLQKRVHMYFPLPRLDDETDADKGDDLDQWSPDP